VLDYHEHAVGAGSQAQAVAYVECRVDDQRSLFGVGVDPHVASAMIKAVMSALWRSGVPLHAASTALA
jgi:2-isopropylmalate synthase